MPAVTVRVDQGLLTFLRRAHRIPVIPRQATPRQRQLFTSQINSLVVEQAIRAYLVHAHEDPQSVSHEVPFPITKGGR